MNAALLSDLLLEVNVLNPQDLKREVIKLGGHVTDPRAKEWFNRAVLYWLINIDKLAAQPYKAEAEPRGLRASKYNFHPEQGWTGQKLPANQCPECKGQGGTRCKNCKGRGSIQVKDEAGQSVRKPCVVCNGTGKEAVCQSCQGTGRAAAGSESPTEDPRVGAIEKTYRRPITGHYSCPTCGGLGRILPEPTKRQKWQPGRGEEGEGQYVRSPDFPEPETPLAPENVTDPAALKRWLQHFPVCSTCGGTGLVESAALVAQLLWEQDEPPDPEGVYTSMLHQPDVKKQMQQSFTPFKEPTAARSWLPGQPPPKSATPEWATPEKELYHFNPIQVRRRELFDRLNNLVHYLNWLHHLLSKLRDPAKLEAAKAQARQDWGEEGVEQVESEQAQAEKAKELFDQLGRMRPDDIDGFRRLMREAQEFARMVVEMPWLYHHDAQMVGRHSNIKVTKVVTPELADTMTHRPVGPNTDVHPVWCTTLSRQAVYYCNQGPLYFVDKNGYPYVLIHFETHQAMDIRNAPITVAVCAEIAPALNNTTEFPLAKFGTPTALNRVGADAEVGLAGLAYVLRRTRHE